MKQTPVHAFARALVLAPLVIAASARADQVTILAARDNTLYAESGAESNGAGDSFFAGTTGMSQLRRALIAFDVAAPIPPGSTVNSVQLILYMSKTNAGPKTIELHKVTATWGEGTSNAPSGEGSGTAAATNDATWSHRFFGGALTWTTAGGDYVAAASGSQVVDQIGSYTFGSSAGMVTDVQSWVDVPSSAQGWILVNTDLLGTPTAKRFSSRTNPTGSQRPKLVVDYTPPSPFTIYCSGDGTGTACPCANPGLAGNGCANSVNSNGAHVAASGNPSLSSDSMTLVGTAMPDSSALYFQGTTQQSAGAGQVFGDGLRCASGSIIRLGTKTNSAGTSHYPAGNDPSISVKGVVTAPGTRTYQCWYRNAAVYCTTSTFNLTNGLETVWTP